MSENVYPMDEPAATRFMEKVTKDDSGCWEWAGHRNADGYGIFWLGRSVRAHRVAYRHFVGQIPDGLHLDHLCRNRACVNPQHLEIVTNRENVLRGEGRTAANAQKTECSKGHPFDERSRNAQGRGRVCRVCQTEINRVRRATLRVKCGICGKLTMEGDSRDHALNKHRDEPEVALASRSLVRIAPDLAPIPEGSAH